MKLFLLFIILTGVLFMNNEFVKMESHYKYLEENCMIIFKGVK